MRTVLPILALTLSLSSLVAQSPIRVLTLDSSRYDSCQGTSYSYSANGFFQFAYLELTNIGNFGPSGKVKRSVKFVQPVKTLTAQALTNADVVILGQTKDQSDLPKQEIALLNSFLCKGGGVVAFGNWAGQALLPVTQGKLGAFKTAAFKTKVGTPMTSGPFGASNPNAVLKSGWSGAYSALGAGGTVCITRGTDIVGASYAFGLGKLIVLTDEEIIASTLKIGCGSSGWDVESRKIWLNSFAWTIPADGFSFGTNDVLFSVYGTGCPGTKNLAPRALWSGRPKAGGYLQVNIDNARPSTAGVFLSGTQRFTKGSCWLHVLPIAFTVPLSTDPAGNAVLGSKIPTSINLKGALLLTQVALIDDKGANGLSTSNGAEVRFR